MKVVLDTNILISGIAKPNGPPGLIVSAWLGGIFDLVVSDELLDEIKLVFLYKKIQKFFAAAGISSSDLDDFVDILRLKAVCIDASAAKLPVEPPDIKDRHVLQALIASNADYLVTGDKRDLLSLGLNNLVTAKDFSDRLYAFATFGPIVPTVPTVPTVPIDIHVKNVVARVQGKRSLLAKKFKKPPPA